MREVVPPLRRIGASVVWRSIELARTEFAVLVTICIVAGGIWLFLALADEVTEGETERFDRAILLAFRKSGDPSDPVGPLWVEEAMRDVTALGSNFVLAFVTIAVLGFLLLARKRSAALLVSVSVAGGAALGTLLKLVFDRPRPDLVPHGAEVYTASFPSNHAMLSAVTYLTLGALLAGLQASPRIRVYFLAVSVLLTLLVGVSRVYLGVHWPTDVIAGWGVGAAWAMGVWLIASWLRRRGKVEHLGEE